MKLVVLYAPPDDPDAFDRHYFEVHAPLVEKIPGLDRWESARLVAAADGGDQPFFRIVELYFADQATFQSAMGSPEGKATATDYQQIASPGSRLLVAAVD
jgi:uncharacterized protein (TIGR02118 family)